MFNIRPWLISFLFCVLQEVVKMCLYKCAIVIKLSEVTFNQESNAVFTPNAKHRSLLLAGIVRYYYTSDMRNVA